MFVLQRDAHTSSWSRAIASGACMSRGQSWEDWDPKASTGRTEHLSPRYWRDSPCMTVFPSKGPSASTATCEDRMRLLVLFVSFGVLCLLSVLICVASQVYMYIRCVYVVYMCALCTCAFWEHGFSLVAGWTWGYGDVGYLPLLGNRA